MESSWRRNVWEYGLTRVGLTGAMRLAARYLDDTRLILCDGIDPAVYPNHSGYYLPGTEFPDHYQPIPFPGGGAHFPYGWNVEPDVHV